MFDQPMRLSAACVPMSLFASNGLLPRGESCSTLTDTEQVSQVAAALDTLAEPLELNDGPDPFWPPYNPLTNPAGAGFPVCGLGMMPMTTLVGLYCVYRRRGHRLL